MMMISGRREPIVQYLSEYTPAEAIAVHEDLMIEILLRLPVKSLLRFKSVSKQWFSLISNPNFSRNHSRLNPNLITGLFYYKYHQHIPRFEFIHLDSNQARARVPSLAFPNTPVINILQSCNGLLLCRLEFNLAIGHESTYYICNPTTKQSTALPEPSVSVTLNKYVVGVNLAFDPSKSPHYKVVCVQRIEGLDGNCQIEIYSSESRSWRLSGGTFAAPIDVDYQHGVLWNGSIHWLSHRDTSPYFMVDSECLKTMTMPPLLIPSFAQKFRYFGESRGHLHLIEYSSRFTDRPFDLFEMERDYSGWFVKYRVNLNDLGFAFPGMVRTGFLRLIYLCRVLCVVRGEKEEEEEDLAIVMSVPGKVISYNPKDVTSKVLRNLPGPADELLRNEAFIAYQYSETLSCV